jgi:hypothetical protein
MCRTLRCNPHAKGLADEEIDPVVHYRSRERVTTHRCQRMLDGTNHFRARWWPGFGHALAVIRAEQLRLPKPVDSTPDITFTVGERVPQQLPHPSADEVGHGHAYTDCHVHAHYAGPHRYGDAWDGQAGREQYRGPRGYAADRRERQPDVLRERAGHQW